MSVQRPNAVVGVEVHALGKPDKRGTIVAVQPLSGFVNVQLPKNTSTASLM